MTISSLIKKLWCRCIDPKPETSHYIRQEQICPICERWNPKDHYHCGICSKILLEVMLKDA